MRLRESRRLTFYDGRCYTCRVNPSTEAFCVSLWDPTKKRSVNVGGYCDGGKAVLGPRALVVYKRLRTKGSAHLRRRLIIMLCDRWWAKMLLERVVPIKRKEPA